MSIETKEGLFALMEQIAEEREAARPIVEQLVASGEPLEDIEIPEGWRTAGMVLELCEAANANNESDPWLSLLLAQIALPISMRFVDEWLSQYLEARAWNEVGYANRYLCTYGDALQGHAAAERLFGRLGLTHGVARAQFLRAAVLFRAAKYDECETTNRSVRNIFAEFGDKHQLIKCDALHAMVARFRGNFEVAREELEKVLTQLEGTDDLHTLGITCQALGDTYRCLGRLSEAVGFLDRARQIFLALDMPGEVNRADFVLGNVLLDRGETGRALPILTRLRDDYLRRNMVGEAGEIGLMIADAFVATGELDRARGIVEQVLKELIDAKLQKPVVTALSYLRDLMHTTSDPMPAIRHVRSYLERVNDKPDLLFAPLEDAE